MFESAFPTPLTSQSYQLSGGKAGVIQTARVMRDMVQVFKRDVELRSFALSLVEGLPQKDHAGEINTLFEFVRDQIRYVQDINDVETLQTPDKTLEIGQGDCDDKATLLATLLETIGFRTSFKLAGYHGNEYEHVYVYVEGAGEALHLDATEPEPAGYEPPGATIARYVE